jgi:hypothetical protein
LRGLRWPMPCEPRGSTVFSLPLPGWVRLGSTVALGAACLVAAGDRNAGFVALALISSSALVHVVKLIAVRPRPEFFPPLIDNAGRCQFPQRTCHAGYSLRPGLADATGKVAGSCRKRHPFVVVYAWFVCRGSTASAFPQRCRRWCDICDLMGLVLEKTIGMAGV